MSDGFTEEWLASYQAKHPRLKMEIVSVEPKVKARSEPNHDYKAEFEQQLSLVKIEVEHEFYFARPRRWRADWRIRDTRILIEYEGGLFMESGGAHKAVANILRDVEKYNTAALQGWIVIRITPKHVVSGEALGWVIEAIEHSQTHKHLTGG